MRCPGCRRCSNPLDVYAADRPGGIAAVARSARPLIYVPNSEQHGRRDRPAHLQDRAALRRRRAAAARGALLRPEDAVGRPTTRATASRRSTRAPASPGRPVPVDDPYNLYFTPDGRYAIVVAERLQPARLPRRAHDAARITRCHVPCPGVDHMDFTADGRYAARELRVLRPDGRDRRARASASVTDVAAARRPRCRRTSSSRPTAASSTSPTWPRTASGWSTRDSFRKIGLHPHRRGRARPLREPRLALPLRLEPRRGLGLADLASARARW